MQSPVGEADAISNYTYPPVQARRMNERDVLAAVGSAVLTLLLLIGFDLVTGSKIAWLFNVAIAAVIAVVVAYTRQTTSA
jgi:hypothetical protein